MDRDAQGTRGDESTTGTTGRSGSFGAGGSTSQSGSFGAGSTPEGSSFGASGASGASFGGAEDAGTRAGSYDRKFTGEEEGIRDRVSGKIEEGKEKVHDALDSGKDRMSGALDASRNRVADQLGRLGERIEDRARTMDNAGGLQRRAGQYAHRAGDALDSSAQYLRDHDAAEMRDDLERSIRERPLLSVGIAAGAGFLLARLLRD